MNGINDEQEKIGTGEGESPLAPPPQQKMDMRTMNSDLQSLQDTGGQSARPYIPPPPMPTNKPQEPVFQPPQVETPTPASIPPMAGAPMNMPVSSEPAKPKAGKWLWAVLIVAVVLALAAVGYFAVYPALVSTPTQPTETAQPPIQEPPVTPPAEEPPIVTPPIEEPTPSSADLLPTMTGHISLFTTTADDTIEILLPEATVASLRSVAASSTNAAGFHELVFINSSGQRISPKAILSLLVPTFFDQTTLNYFEEDATFFVSTDQNSSWLGYVLKLKSDADIGAVQSRMAAIQKDLDNGNLFLKDAGEIGIWRDGQIAGKPASLVDFSEPDAALGYTWLGRNLLIITNLSAGETAADRLGF